MNFKFLLTNTFLLLITLSSFAQYQVGHQSFAFDDASRNNRNVFGEVYYPADVQGDDVALAAGEFPLVVFGHGFVTAWSEYSVWWEELVAEGYIVALPRTEGNIAPNHSNFGQDLAFIIDAYLLENDDASSDFYQHLSGKNAVMGHSMGGGASYLAAGTYNANIETMVTLAAASTNPSSITAAANVDVPVLAIAGENDCVVQNGEGPLDIYNGLSIAPYKAYVEILGASHCNFGINSFFSNCSTGEFCSASITKTEQHNQMFLSTVPWLDYMLKGDCNAWTTFKNHLTTSSAHTYLEMGALPLPTVSLAASSYLCSNTSVDLVVDVSDAYCDIEWFKNGNIIAGETGTTYTASSHGTYTASVSNADGMTTDVDTELYKHQLLFNDNFDTDYGNWNNGGVNCRRSILDAAYANSGDYCIRLRKNTFYSKVTSDVLDLTGYDEARIDFSYYARSMDNQTEGFLLQMTTDGQTYTTIEDWYKGIDFQNDQRKYDSVVIPGPFTSTTRFRFKCDGNGFYDWVYLDNIKIYVCGEGIGVARNASPNELASTTSETKKESVKESTAISDVYPNPAKDVLNFNVELETEQDINIYITDIVGKLKYQKSQQGMEGFQQIALDISTLNTGYYILVVETGDDRLIKKFTKQ